MARHRARVGQITAHAQTFHAVQRVFRLGIGQQHRAMFAHVHQVHGRQWVARVYGFGRRSALGAQAKQDARRHVGVVRGGHSAGTQRHRLQLARVVLQVACQVDTEVGQCQVRDGDAAGQVLQIDHCVLQLEQLLAAVLQVIHRVAGLLLDEVFFTSCRHIQQHHAPAHALLEVQVLLQLHVGPEVGQLDRTVRRPEAVDTTEALDDPHWIPVDVIVHQPVTVLEVLAFADAVGGDQQIQLALGR